MLTEAIKKVLLQIFNNTNYSQQPKFIVEVGCSEGDILRDAYEFIKSQTSRGKKLKEVPLEVVALIQDESKLQTVRKNLSSVPHRIQADVKIPQAVFISKTSDPIETENSFGWILLKPSIDLLHLASQGWFPKEKSLIHFEKRPYTIRLASTKDLPRLEKLEALCWPKDLIMHREVLQKRIETYPEGQLVLENSTEGILGVVYSQRIRTIEDVYNKQADTVSELHDPNGPFVQLLALNILPEKQQGELGGQLLEFMLQKATLTSGVTNVIGVTRCVNYPGLISMEDYLKQEILDPVPNMHVLHGGQILGVVKNYRPKDTANEGYGVLVFYSLKDREYIHTASKVSTEIEITREIINKYVEDSIKKLLSGETYSQTKPLMDMGLDSLQLMELRSDLSEKFALELESTFFFEYGTAEAAIEYLIEKKLEHLKDWLYEITWVPKPIQQSIPFEHDRLWVIFHEDGEMAQKLSEFLKANFQYCILVKSGEKFQKINDESFEVDPKKAQDFNRLLHEIPNLSQLAGIICLGENEKVGLTFSEINKNLERKCEGLIHFANALALAHVPETSRLWVIDTSITNDGTVNSLVQSPYAALCKVIQEEYPKSHCTHLAIEENVQIICNELTQIKYEPRIAYRDNLRLVARLIPTSIEKIQQPILSPDASYLVAGGLQPLGLQVVRWYVEHGAKTVIIIDEKEVSNEAKIEIDQLKVLGANIVTYTVRFDDYPILEIIIGGIKNLKGLILSAGVLSHGLLMHVTWENSKDVIRLKIAGSWNLHKLTEKLELDHFILFSSCLKDLAPLGKASMTIANSFLDSLSYYRRNLGLPALSINWAPWELRKMVIQNLADNTLASGLRVLNVHEGMFILEHLFYFDKPRVIAVQVDWDLLLTHSQYNNPLFDEIASQKSKKTKIIEHEPIAIIGMGCRFPGGADSPEKFWNIFKEGIDTITEVPPDRWDIDAYYDPDRKAPGKMYTRFGGFINDVSLFDSQFFGISPREAEDMDPQQRIALEVTWEALENAGISPDTLKGSNTGVFMGICFNDYGQLITQSGDISAVDDYYSTGNHFSVVAGRISYILGLQGPAMAIDTACSSSLVSIDNAFKHLQYGECDMAIAGGVNLILAPEPTINFCKSGMLAEDGRCKTFDAAANGYVRSEGCGILILKRLSDAKNDNNRILGIIRSTAINQDGTSTGLTVPNGQAQEMVIRKALASAKLEGKDIDYVEAHGTGTSLGDPIEVKAIVATYGKNRSKPLLLGSAKTNIGHAEAAAGVAGLIKCVLALQNKIIPKHLHFNKLNPHITLENVEIAQNETSWENKEPRFAAISSFGFSGTNSHAIVESSSQEVKRVKREEYALILSGMSEAAVSEQLKQLKAFLETHPDVDLNRVAYTLQLGRKHFNYRTALFYSDGPITESLQSTVNKWLEGAQIDWRKFYPEGCIPISLPTYPFQRESYWAKAAIKTRMRTQEAIGAQHPFLSERHPLATGALLVKGAVDIYQEPLFQDHCVYEHMIFPAAGFIDAILSATGYVTLSNLSIEAPLALSEHHSSMIHVLISPDNSVRLDSQSGAWTNHVNAKIEAPREKRKITLIKYDNKLDPEEFYHRKDGLEYKAQFQGLKSIMLGDGEALAKIKLDKINPQYVAHPAIVDCSFQLVAALAGKRGTYLPVGFDSICIHGKIPSEIWAHVKLKTNTDDLLQADIELCDDNGNVLGELLGYTAKNVKRESFLKLLDRSDDLFYEIKLVPFSGEESTDSDIYSGDLDEGLLKLIQNPSPRICIVKKRTDYKKGSLIGFVRTVQNEYPHLDISLIEYENDTDLPKAIKKKSKHLIVKDGKYYTPVLQRVDLKPSNKELFKPDATYLITGGGALGLELAKWLIAHGANSIGLMIRNKPNEKQQIAIDALGEKVKLIMADVTDLNAVKKGIPSNLKGVFHTAGTVDDGMIQQQSWSRFEKVLAPKVQGSLNLHEATKDLPLDYFVLYSSIVSLCGLPGQSNYAAANSFMDELAHHRRGLGLPAQSINWGPWGEVGMAVRQHMNISGMHNLTIKQGVDALDKILNSNITQVAVSPIEWKSFLATFTEVPSMFKNFDRPKESIFDLKVELIKSENKEKFIEEYLIEQVRKVLELRKEQPLETSRGFFELGMDSLMATQLKNKLQKDAGKELINTLIFAYPNIEALSEYYKKEVFPEFFETQTESIEDEVENMSAEDIDRLLDEEF